LWDSAVFLPAEQCPAYLIEMACTDLRTPFLALFMAAAGSLGPLAAHAELSSRPIDAFVVREGISKDIGKINRCYESALRYEPALSGKVSVRFAVVRNGNVQGVQVIENTTGNDHMERCVARVVRAIRFPSRRTGKSLRFTFPFVFAPQDSP
jgi:TonB family protein